MTISVWHVIRGRAWLVRVCLLAAWAGITNLLVAETLTDSQIADLQLEVGMTDARGAAAPLAPHLKDPPAALLRWQGHAVKPDSHLCNLHDCLQKVGEVDAVVWFGCRVRCSEPMSVAVRLGYDGPVKLFLDGRAVFHDPDGTNPARPDMAAPEVALAAGDHDSPVASGASQGHAWGVFLRLQRSDLAAAATPILPEISL